MNAMSRDEFLQKAFEAYPQLKPAFESGSLSPEGLVKELAQLLFADKAPFKDALAQEVRRLWIELHRESGRLSFG